MDKFCGKYGKEIKDENKYCPRCGAEIRNKSVFAMRVIGLSIIIFLIVAGIVLILWTAKKDTETREKIAGTYIGEKRNWILQMNEEYRVRI